MDFSIPGFEISPFLPPLIAFAISFFTSMAGVSGAFLLLPLQVSFLGFTGIAVSSTNLVYNLVATPSGVYRFFRENRMSWPLTVIIAAGTLPGVLAGVYVRIQYLPDPRLFKLFVGCVLLYIGLQLLIKTARSKEISEQNNAGNLNTDTGVHTVSFSLTKTVLRFGKQDFAFSPVVLALFSFVVGIIGGIYGIGGGALIAPFCAAVLGLPVYIIAGATLFSTFLASCIGIFYFYIAPYFLDVSLSMVAPNWTLGLLFGIGGFAGIYFGARMQKYFPEKFIKIVLGFLISFLALRYILQYFS